MLSRLLRPFALGLLLTLGACALLPHEVQRATSHALADTADTQIGRVVAPLVAAHPGESGLSPLFNAREAFAARWLLAGSAQRSIDVQYYIWHADTSGGLLAHALWEAAERGVRVRVLLDDGNTGGLDPEIAAMNAHPNIEVRLFNPFPNRTWRVGDFVGDFGRVNRRMHNKSFTVDNQVAVVGGRNIGDEYLGANPRMAFTDLDVMAIGPVVNEVSAAFDRYWNSASAYPAGSLLPPPTALELAQIRAKWERRRGDAMAVNYLEAVRTLALMPQMKAGTLPLHWGPARVLSDDPSKVLQPLDRTDLQIQPMLMEAFGMPQRELLLVSPYFVPGARGAGMLADMARSGIRVSVLTNSLAATDVPSAYAGYARYRVQLLRAGVHLYELKTAAQPLDRRDGEDVRAPGGIMGSGSGGSSSSASLHAKTFAMDRSRIFVGSFNLDPRSARLNTEMGVVMESPPLATQLASAFEEAIPGDAYELRLGDDGNVVWVEHTPQGEVRYTSAPGVGTVRGFWTGLLGVLPIEWLL
jgi:putative cardiolipin synthase